ncbi:RNA polymerase factor sigma-54 [Anderseniella sp. Alg231-50]|uniref:RNA polymerase factor sigma-54 n=1 Tax=Anderseniella sp. Alg231-50 TaxID=1922226 RepID=UPI000D54AFC7
MALSQKLQMRQGQSLVMTPQLQQAIKLLQMSNFELQAYVESELESNPLLERDERDEAGRDIVSDSDGQTVSDDAAAGTELKDTADQIASGENTPENLDQFDTGLENVYADEATADKINREAADPMGMQDSGWQLSSTGNTAGGNGSGGGGGYDGEMAFDATLASESTLADHLTEQLHLTVSDPAMRMIGAHLIGLVNEAGYLTGDVATVADTLGATVDLVEQTLAIVQTFDPPGILARDLKECLAIQLRERDRFDPAMQVFIDNLDLLAKHDFARLKTMCKVDMDDLRDMADEVRSLNPKPGNVFGSIVVQPVVPDVIVRPAPDGSWAVELNTETLPRVLVNNQYFAQVSRGTTRDADKLYLSDCMSNATWLVKSLDQRARTILAVAREIVRQQDAFLMYGVEHLRPLNLKTVADAISMHESTISRVTSNKYFETPRGVFELKYFFTTAISSSAGGDDHSAESVRHKIRAMIDEETAAKILSDDQIVEMLRAEGIDIARRTVAKYREAMQIPSSIMRRRQKRMLEAG